jgi:chaperonin GroEL (HSP60 family)
MVEAFKFVDEMLKQKSKNFNISHCLNKIAIQCTNTKNISKFGTHIPNLAVESIFHILKNSSIVNNLFVKISQKERIGESFENNSAP